MTKVLFISFVFHLPFIFIPGAFAQQSQFDTANELMEEHRVEEAFQIYRSILNDGYLSGKLFFNMALASMYQDSLGLAKYYLLQSAEYPETLAEAERTLNYVNDQFNRRSAVLPKLPWERFFEWMKNRFGPSWLLIFGILFFNLGAGSLIGSWFTDRASIWLKRAGYITGIFSLLLISSSFYLDYLDNRFDTGIVVDRQTIVYERAMAGSASISNAYEGYKMTVDTKRSENEPDWYYVRLENGMYGWIERTHVRTF
jgi:hypothetical protein